MTLSNKLTSASHRMRLFSAFGLSFTASPASALEALPCVSLAFMAPLTLEARRGSHTDTLRWMEVQKWCKTIDSKISIGRSNDARA